MKKVSNVLIVISLVIYIYYTDRKDLYMVNTITCSYTFHNNITQLFICIYIRPGYKLSPTTIEAIMLTVNSYNTWYDMM